MTARSDSQKDRPAAEWPPWWIRDGQFRDGETKKGHSTGGSIWPMNEPATREGCGELMDE